jgi:cation diffusion facilitator family transporter
MNRTLRIAWASLAVSVVVLAMKAAAYRLTGSVALYSDALETVINVATAAAALFALWYSARPADSNHRYGHYKAEYFSAIVEGGLVLATAFMIGGAAWQGLDHPPTIRAPWLGIAVNGVAGLFNLLWALVLLHEGRRSQSPALLAGGQHVMTDVWTTAAVLVGFALVPLTGWHWLDPAVAAVVALNILRAGYGVLRSSVGGLMDEVPDMGEVTVVRDAIAEGGDGAIEAHDVRLRVAGRMTFVDFHLVVPSEMTVDAAHVICDRIETAIRDRVGQAVISIHVEPGYKTKQHHPRQDVLLLS